MSEQQMPQSPWKGLENVPSAQPFVEALAQGRFVIQVCGDCGRAQSPARIHCEYCRSSNIDWQPASGDGVIAAITVYHRQYNPTYERQPPYNVAMVQLDNGAFVYGAIEGEAGQGDASQNDVGKRVTLNLPRSAEGMPLSFRLAEGR